MLSRDDKEIDLRDLEDEEDANQVDSLSIETDATIEAVEETEVNTTK